MLPQSSSGRGASGLWEQVDFPGHVLPAVESLFLELPSSPSVPRQRRVASGPWEQEVSQARAACCSGFHLASASATPRLSLMTEKSFRRREEGEHFFQPLSLAEIPVGPPCQRCQALLVTVEGLPLDSWNKGASWVTRVSTSELMQCNVGPGSPSSAGWEEQEMPCCHRAAPLVLMSQTSFLPVSTCQSSLLVVSGITSRIYVILSGEKRRDTNPHHFVQIISHRDPFLKHIHTFVQKLIMASDFTQRKVKVLKIVYKTQHNLILSYSDLSGTVSYYCPSPHLLCCSQTATFLFIKLSQVTQLHTY